MKKTVKILIVAWLLLATFIIVEAFFGPKVNYNCSSFSTYEAALKVFKKDPVDVYRLDADHDGIPCESLIK